MMYWKKIGLCAPLLLLVACQNITPDMQGTLVGGVVGGVIGSAVSDGSAAGVIAGTLVGSYVGHTVADSLQKYRPRIAHTMENSRSSVQTQWVDPDGVRYVLVPSAVVRDKNKVCRPFTLTVFGPQGEEVLRGIACRKGAERWEIISR